MYHMRNWRPRPRPTLSGAVGWVLSAITMAVVIMVYAYALAVFVTGG